MSANSNVSWPQRLEAAANVYDWSEVAQISAEYVRHLRSTTDSVTQAEASQMLGMLRGVRRQGEIRIVADALLGHGLNDAFIKRQFAQALVDRDSPAAARLVYQAILDDPSTPEKERLEALGGVGRCFKQLYLLDQVPARKHGHLAAALAAYREAYDANRGNYWHGINVVALLARAARDGVKVEDVPDLRADSARIAREVLDFVETVEPPGLWELATACEAGVALGDHDVAIARATMLIATPEVDAFTLASLLRQLVELWELNTDVLPGQVLVPLLRSAVLRSDGGAVVVDPQDARSAQSSGVSRYESRSGEDLEALLGPERFKGMYWWLTGLQRCRAVARVESTLFEPVGTGFLVDGKQLNPALPDLVLVTNGHVVPEKLPYGEARAVFHGLEGDPGSTRRKFDVARWWWHQPSKVPDLDITILELDAYPAGVTPIPLALDMPRLDESPKPRAYVIGHPGGLDTPQFSFHDNLLIDFDERLVHYRSPTEGGSSGSPVLDNTWSLIAVHHLGGLEVPKLHETGGTYPANEGISVAAIKAKLIESPPRGQDVLRRS